MKRASKYKHFDIISSAKTFKLWVQNVAIYACSSGKLLDYGKYACGNGYNSRYLERTKVFNSVLKERAFYSFVKTCNYQ